MSLNSSVLVNFWIEQFLLCHRRFHYDDVMILMLCVQYKCTICNRWSTDAIPQETLLASNKYAKRVTSVKLGGFD